MKTFFLAVLVTCTLVFSSYAQNISLDASTTRAVVIGISDYQDELDKYWVEELKKEYKVKIQNKTLKKLVR